MIDAGTVISTARKRNQGETTADAMGGEAVAGAVVVAEGGGSP